MTRGYAEPVFLNRRKKEGALDLHHMKEFSVFARHLNMTAAAKELVMTQSNLSKHIKHLENELGFHVVDKRKKKMGLTHEGEIFLNSCNDIMRIYEETVEKCRKSQLSRRGEIIAQEPSYSDSTAEAYYSFIEELRSQVFDADIRYFRPYRKSLVEELAEDKAHIVIVYWREQGNGLAEYLDEFNLVAKRLTCDKLSIWCDVNHPLARAENVRLNDLREVPIVQPNDTYTPIRALLLEYESIYNTRLSFKMVESDRSATLLSMRHPGCVYVLPSSAQNDLRVRVRKDMVFRSLENDELEFVSYAVAKRQTSELFPELKDIMGVDSVNSDFSKFSGDENGF